MADTHPSTNTEKRPLEDGDSAPLAKRQFVGICHCLYYLLNFKTIFKGSAGATGVLPAGGAPAAPEQQEHSERVVVPNSRIGNVIGKKGANIKMIREISGARINVSDNTPYGSDRVVCTTLPVYHDRFTLRCK